MTNSKYILGSCGIAGAAGVGAAGVGAAGVGAAGVEAAGVGAADEPGSVSRCRASGVWAGQCGFACFT